METLLLRYGYALVFLGVAVEGEAVLLTAAVLASRGFFRLPVVVAVALAANSLADQVYFQLARLRGRSWLERRFGQHPRYHKLLSLVSRRGGLLLLVSRFAYGLRIAIPAACGALGMGVVAFTLLDLLAGAALGPADGRARLLRRRRARPAARRPAPLSGRARPGARRRSRRRAGGAARSARRPLARAGLGRASRARAVRGRPARCRQPALGSLASRARTDARARAVAAARGDAAQPCLDAARGDRPAAGHPQPRPAQGPRVVGRRGGPLGLARLPPGAGVRPASLARGGAAARLPGCLPTPLLGAQRPRVAAPGAADGAGPGSDGLGLRGGGPRRPAPAVHVGRWQYTRPRSGALGPADPRPRRRAFDRARRPLPGGAADRRLGGALLRAGPRAAPGDPAPATGGVA